MKRTKIGSIKNNIIYVEPNYTYSEEEYGKNGLNTYEFTPPLEDYSIFVNLEVETRGRNVQSSKSSNNRKLILSFVTNTDGTSAVNFMQGTKIPIGKDGTTINSLTTNYTDMFLSDLKKNGPSTECFGIESIDISYNNWMVPEVTIEFIDVRGVSLFAQKEYYETNKNIDTAINSNNKEDIANTFFQCFFTFPYPKFTLLVKGFYGQPVSYELTCADFRARFDSKTGNFACTAKFVGYYFSFLNDVMMNGIIAAPYSDYIGSKYWDKKAFKIKGNSGNDINMPKIGWLLGKFKEIESTADKIAQSDPVSQEKTMLDSKTNRLQVIETAYNEFVDSINRIVTETYKEENLYYRVNTDNGALRAAIILSNNDNGSEFRVYFKDVSGQIKGRYNAFIKKLNDYNNEFPNEKLPIPDSFYDSKPSQRIFNHGNNNDKATMFVNGNNDIKEEYPELYKLFKNGVDNGNKKTLNPLLEYKEAYYYRDRKFAATLEEYKKNISEKTTKAEGEIEKIKDTAISKALGFHPTVENMTKIVMAHFETFARMILETAKTICNEKPSRTISSLEIDARTVSDVPNKGKSSDVFVPPFPKVVNEIKKNGTTVREESWVGDYSKDFREKDLIHGIINSIKEIAEEIKNYNSSGQTASNGGSETSKVSVMNYPLSPIDVVATEKPYDSGGYDSNDVSSLLGLVGLRAISIFGLNNFKGWGANAKVLGIAEACNLLQNHKLSKEMLQKIYNISGDDVVKMMKGDDSGTIKRPGDGTKPWPWRLKVDKNKDGMISSNGDLDICRIQGNAFAVPYQNLSWSKINSETLSSINGAKAEWSEDYINTKGFINLINNNTFTFDTNVNRFSSIIENQLKGLDGIEYYSKKFLTECKYNEDKYEDLINNGENIIAYIIENASALTPSDESCMLPTSINSFSNKSFGGGYDMDKFSKEYPGEGSEGWFDKDGNKVKRKGSDGYKNYLKDFNSRDYTFTEFPGLFLDLKPTVDTSIFGEYLYYEQKSDKSKALLFLASLGYVFDYNKIIKDYVTNDNITISILPLPSIMFIGALLWYNTEEGRNSKKYYHTHIEGDYYYDSLMLLLTLRKDIKRRFIKIFENWVDKGVENDSLLRSFKEIKSGLEIDFKSGYKNFFINIGEQEEKKALFGKVDWWKERFKGKYVSLMDFYKGELGESFFRNYITIDEDSYGSTLDYTRGIRLGNRDGGPSTVHACNFALAGCVFSKNSKFFKENSTKNVNVNTGTIKLFFDGFLERLKEEKINDSNNANTQISQAKEPDDSNTDIKIGIYRYCKLIYDKWIAGLTDDDFDKRWTVEAFFSDSADNNKYFHFIDAYYNQANDIPISLGNFCDNIVSCYRSEQYSLLSFLSSIYSFNKFSFNCVQNFVDLSKKDNMESMFDAIPYTGKIWKVNKHPNFVVVYSYEPSSKLADIDNSEYENDGFMINQEESTKNIWPEPLKSRNANASGGYSVPAFGVSYGKMYQSYFKDIDVSMDNPTVTEQSIKAQFAIACQNNTGEQTGDRSTLYTYGQDLYSIYSNNSYTCNVTMMGCAWVQPLMYFVLNNIPMFRGTYLIEKVSHHIEPGNMITKFMGVRMSNVCTRIVQNEAIRSRNNQTGNGESNGLNPQIEEKFAGVDNDCPYKEYPLTATNEGIGNLENMQLTSNEMENAKLTVQAFISMGYTDIAGAAVAGNIMQETHYVSKYVNKMAKANHNPGMKGGLCQWQLDRLTHLVKWDMSATGTITNEGPMPPFGKQLMFIDRECKEISTYKKTLNALKGATSDDKLENATEVFRSNYEGGSEKEKRISYAKKILAEYRKNPPVDKTPKIENNGDSHISELSNGFLHALNKTAAASSNDVEIGVDSSKSNGDTLWLTNAKKSKNFSSVMDMIISTYSGKISNVNWILPGNGESQNSVPAAYLVTVKEGSKFTTINVTTENNPNTSINKVHISKGKDNSGMHNHFCKALVKKYKSLTNELKKDTNNKLDDYEALFKDEKYKLQSCNEIMNENGINSDSGGKENEFGFIGNWNVGNFVNRLHYWQSHVCEEKGKGRSNYGGCHSCTGAVNRALRDEKFGTKYWGTYPWEVYEKLSKSDSDFIEIRSGSGVTNKTEFSLGTVNKGDICVMWTPDKKTHFHTCAYDGSNWYSDFKQNSCNIYRSSKPCTMDWHLFRHKS